MNDDHGGAVLVGYDGSPAGDQALHWAVEEADLRRVPLTVCHAWHWPYPSSPPDDDTLEIFRAAAAIVADEGVRKAHAQAEDMDVHWRLERGQSGTVLQEAAVDAGLVVLGARGHGGFGGLSVGFTAVQVCARGARPVIVVRSGQPQVGGHGGRLVVGVDGSPASEAALGFAFEEAALRRASVTAVCSWWDPAVLPGPDRVPFTDPQVIRSEAMARFDQAVAPWQREHPNVPLDTEFVVDPPRQALVNAAQGAALLVVGDRGIGSVPQMLLGPVTQAALQQAPCPVAVVPAQQAE
ncbi:universal stress protein [Actinomadura sp. NAK00032]|uniref:universal stress protein n=1 Tax=Actinomadura sp. NAK00032 TaxID=2742128 RepID=UPI0015923259|nr:universal stress protein [Actinomadura sp. NAK00032]QKW37011.1 universal stress protein [Actinomadura sp. NAK00032]